MGIKIVMVLSILYAITVCGSGLCMVALIASFQHSFWAILISLSFTIGGFAETIFIFYELGVAIKEHRAIVTLKKPKTEERCFSF